MPNHNYKLRVAGQLQVAVHTEDKTSLVFILHTRQLPPHNLVAAYALTMDALRNDPTADSCEQSEGALN